jgi:predicted PurR-regulated permease PerM
MSDSPGRYDFDRVFRLLLTVGTIGGTIWLLAYLSDVLAPFAVAVLLAYILNPIVNAFESRVGSRPIAVGLTLAIFGVLTFVTLPLVGWLVVREATDIVHVVQGEELKARLHEQFELWGESLGERWREGLAEVKASVKASLDQLNQENVDEIKKAIEEYLKDWLVPWARDLTKTGVSLLGGVLNLVLAMSVVIVILLYLVFLMLDFNSFQAHWQNQLPPTYREGIVGFVNEFTQAMGRYFRGQFLVAMTCGVLFAIGFWIVGIRMAVMLGLFIGLLNMVPYLQTLGLIPALVLALMRAIETGEILWPVVGVLVVFGLVQVAQDGFLVPRIMGQSTGLKPWVIMLSIFVWGKLLGFLGLVLAIPLSCLGLAYYRRMVLNAPSEPDTA